VNFLQNCLKPKPAAKFGLPERKQNKTKILSILSCIIESQSLTHVAGKYADSKNLNM
jgi:hypothetical protein